MNRNPDQCAERLRRYAISITPEVEGRHLATLRAALANTPASTVASRRRPLRHRISFALASLILATAPVGVAVAAEDTVPGDLLYPVKQLTERVRSVIDHDLPAEHRIDELETLLDRDAEATVIARQMERARLALENLDDGAELRRRFERAVDRIRPVGDNPPGDGPTTSNPPGDGRGGEGTGGDRVGGNGEGGGVGNQGTSGEGSSDPQGTVEAPRPAHQDENGNDDTGGVQDGDGPANSIEDASTSSTYEAMRSLATIRHEAGASGAGAATDADPVTPPEQVGNEEASAGQSTHPRR